jgi:hypothetical protein
MLAVVEVNLVGGDPWWHQVIGPALIAVTAIVAAAIAAQTANRRQATQLKENRVLQTELLKDQLSHDRAQRNREHIRDTIDDAVQDIDALVRIMAEYQAEIITYDGNRDRLRREAEDETKHPETRSLRREHLRKRQDELVARSGRVFDALINLISDRARLSLRLGNDHLILKSQLLVTLAFQKRHDFLRPLAQKALTDEDRQQIKNQADTAEEAVKEFLDACRGWFAE